MPIMESWKKHLKGDPVDWLLEEENPSVRYFTLKGIVGKMESDPEVKQAKAQIMLEGVVPQILETQNEGGFWGRPQDFYVGSKYKSTVWNFLLLAELGADRGDKRIKAACEFILVNSQHAESGAFAYRNSKQGDGEQMAVLPCLTGNQIFSLIRLGNIEDSRVQRGIKWITTYLRCDDGDGRPPKSWPYERYPQCWGKHTCHMGVIKMLRALAEIPINKRSPEVKQSIAKAAEYFLTHHVYKRSHDLSQAGKTQWLAAGFPLMWGTDALEILGTLTKLGYRDERMQSALDLIIAKQDAKSRWPLEKSLNGRMQVRIERKGQPSKWITLKAMSALKAFYGPALLRNDVNSGGLERSEDGHSVL
jgi:hypothetical protein